jgi:hypothetical protein
LPAAIAYTPIRLASEVLFGSNEDVLREEIKKEKETFEKKEKELKERAVPIYVSGNPKDMQTVCASVDMKKADAKIRAICDAEKSSPLSVEMKGGGIFSRSVAPQRVTPEVLQKKNQIGAILVPVFGPEVSKAIINAAFDEVVPDKRDRKLKSIDVIVQTLLKPVPEPLDTNQIGDIFSAFNNTNGEKNLAKKILDSLSPQNILNLKKKKEDDTLATLKNLCVDPNLAETEGCKLLKPKQIQQIQPRYLPPGFYGGKSRKNKKTKRHNKTKRSKTNKTNKTNKTSRRNKSSKR